MATTTTILSQQGHKCWNLSETETYSSFLNWKRILLFNLSLQPRFKPFLVENVKWKPVYEDQLRGFVDEIDETADASKSSDDKTTVTKASKSSDDKTAVTKARNLEDFLAQIASYSPVHIHYIIINDSVSLNHVWTIIREYYSLQQSEVSFLEIAAFTLQNDERPAHLYYRLLAHVRDNLLTISGGLTHNGVIPGSDEIVSPTVERLVVIRWLEILHKNLPAIVARSYAHELQSKSLKDIQPSILKNVQTLLLEAESLEQKINVNRSFSGSNFRRNPRGGNNSQYNRNNFPNSSSYGRSDNYGNYGTSGYKFSNEQFNRNAGSNKNQYTRNNFPNSSSSYGRSDNYVNSGANKQKLRICPICQAKRMDHRHSITTCPFLPPEDRPAFLKFRAVDNNVDFIDDAMDNEVDPGIATGDVDFDFYDDDEFQNGDSYEQTYSIKNVFNDNANVSHVKRVATARSPTFQGFCGSIPMSVICDSGAESTLVNHSSAIKAGLDISPSCHIAKQVGGIKLKVIGETYIELSYRDLKLNTTALVVPGIGCDVLGGVPFLKENMIVIDIPKSRLIVNDTHTIPFSCSKYNGHDRNNINRVQSILQPNVSSIVQPGEFLSVNVGPDVLHLNKVAIQPRADSLLKFDWPPPQIVDIVGGEVRIKNDTFLPISVRKQSHLASIYPVCDDNIPMSASSFPLKKPIYDDNCYLNICIDVEKKFPQKVTDKFRDLNCLYKDVFHPSIGRYNDASGKVRASINVGPTEPPPNKVFLPAYDQKTMKVLQEKFDEMEVEGVFARPEDLDVEVQYISPSFLIKKPNNSLRLVTAFNNIAKFTRMPPSSVVSIDKIFHFLAQFKHFIKTDMTSQFFQLPMKHTSLKYAGVMTPYKGIRIYTRAAMGMPGSSEHLDTLMSRVIGHLATEGCVLRINDDLFIGGETIEELYCNWGRLIQCFRENNLRLKAIKTFILPQEIEILGWIWSGGDIKVSPHKINPLVNSSPPGTVKGLRGWVGAYKFLKCCIPGYSSLLSHLEKLTANRQSTEQICWSDEDLFHFNKAKKALSDPKTIKIPKFSDQLIICSDASIEANGIGSVLYCKRDDNLYLGGYFSAKLPPTKVNYQPCEIEALAITSAVNHWSHYIVQSELPTQVLTDSKPCVQAMNKLQKGQFSNSQRVSTFLSCLSRFNVILTHISGDKNIFPDFASRNPVSCIGDKCQVCEFVVKLSNSVIRTVSTDDVLNGLQSMPYTNRVAWINCQKSCPDLRKVHANLHHATRPSKKLKGMKSIKRYLNHVSIANDGLLVVKKSLPFIGSRELIVIPQQVLHGFITAVHIRLNHPTRYQLVKLFNRYFFSLDVDKALDILYANCQQCSALATLPRETFEFSTSLGSHKPGIELSADVIKRQGQKILVLRDNYSSFIKASLVNDELADTLKEGLLTLCADFVSPQGCCIRVDNQPWSALVNNKTLLSAGIKLILGEVKNTNKNPIAERGIGEVQNEIRKAFPDGSKLTVRNLAQVIASINSKIRFSGLSSYELLFQRDRFTNEQLSVDPHTISELQNSKRIQNHPHSAKSKSRNAPEARCPEVSVGDLVYIKAEVNKVQGREPYMIMSIQDKFVMLQKFGHHKLLNKLYKLPISQIIKIPSQCSYEISPPGSHNDDNDDCDDNYYYLIDEKTDNMSNSDHPLIIDTSPCINDNILPRKSTRPKQPPDRYTPY